MAANWIAEANLALAAPNLGGWTLGGLAAGSAHSFGFVQH